MILHWRRRQTPPGWLGYTDGVEAPVAEVERRYSGGGGWRWTLAIDWGKRPVEIPFGFAKSSKIAKAEAEAAYAKRATQRSASGMD